MANIVASATLMRDVETLTTSFAPPADRRACSHTTSYRYSYLYGEIILDN